MAWHDLMISHHVDAWLGQILGGLKLEGYAILENVVAGTLRYVMYKVQQLIQREISHERLKQAKELGVLRLPMKWIEVFASESRRASLSKSGQRHLSPS